MRNVLPWLGCRNKFVIPSEFSELSFTLVFNPNLFRQGSLD